MKIDKVNWNQVGKAHLWTYSVEGYINLLIDSNDEHETAIAELKNGNLINEAEFEKHLGIVDMYKRIEALEKGILRKGFQKVFDKYGVYLCPKHEGGCDKEAVKWFPSPDIYSKHKCIWIYTGKNADGANMYTCSKCGLTDLRQPEPDKEDGSCPKHVFENGRCVKCNMPEPDKPEAPDQDMFDGIDTYVEEGRVVCANCHQSVDGLLNEVCNGHWVCAKCGTTRTERDYPWRDKSKIYNCTRCHGVKAMRWLEAIPPEVTRLQTKSAELNTGFNEAVKEAGHLSQDTEANVGLSNKAINKITNLLSHILDVSELSVADVSTLNDVLHILYVRHLEEDENDD